MVHAEVVIDEALMVLALIVLFVPAIQMCFNSMLTREIRLGIPLKILAVLL